MNFWFLLLCLSSLLISFTYACTCVYVSLSTHVWQVHVCMLLAYTCGYVCLCVCVWGHETESTGSKTNRIVSPQPSTWREAEVVAWMRAKDAGRKCGIAERARKGTSLAHAERSPNNTQKERKITAFRFWRQVVCLLAQHGSTGMWSIWRHRLSLLGSQPASMAEVVALLSRMGKLKGTLLQMITFMFYGLVIVAGLCRYL
jgi:hypothetical protein